MINKNYVDDDVGIKTFANKANDRHRDEGLPPAITEEQITDINSNNNLKQ